MVNRGGGTGKALATRVAEGTDRRYRTASSVRKELSHVFPKHHSFLWGEFAFYSFVVLVLVLSGTFLALFFVPDTTEVPYSGQYENLRGLHMSRAYRSTLDISFEVRGGLFVRQIHHWAALVFIATIVLHMARNFFTGAFRRPREFTWVTGVLLLMVSLLEGYLGYSMLDDLLSGVGVRIFSGLLLSVPLIGPGLHWFAFGGEFEGDLWISRFFTGHVFLLPGLLVALIAVHLALVWYQKHTHFPGPGAKETNVVRDRAAPGFGLRSTANALCVFGVLALMGTFLQITPIFLWGPTLPPTAPPGCSRTGT